MANRFVSPLGSNTSPYDTWAKASPSIATVISAASVGDIIFVDGGFAGNLYETNLSVAKNVTITKGTDSGRDGQVLIRATKGSSGLSISSTCLLSDISWEYVSSGTDSSIPIYMSAGTINFDNFTIERIITESGAGPFVQTTGTANVVFNKLKSKLVSSGATTVPVLMRCNNASASIDIKNSEIKHCGQLYVTAGAIIISKSIIIHPTPKYYTSYTTRVDSGATLTSRNNIYIGAAPCQSVAGAVITSENDFFHNRYDGTVTAFDSANVATVTNSLKNINPKLIDRPSDLGNVFVVVDDTAKIADAYSFAQLATPSGIKVDCAVNIHGDYGKPTAGNIDNMRWLVNNGHDVSAHGSTHSTYANLNGITISATGTSPTLTITGNRNGDSATWAGTLTVTINSVPYVVDIASTSADTLGELVTLLNGRPIGNGVVTCYKTNSTTNTSFKSLCLADISSQSISSNYTALINEAALIRFEAVECILDIENYILNGSDRNGNNIVTGITEPPPVTYKVSQYRTAGGDPRTALRDELFNDPSGIHDVFCGVQVDGTYSNQFDMWLLGGNGFSNELFNIYGWEYSQIASDAQVLGNVLHAWGASRIHLLLYHGLPTYNGSAQNLINLLNSFGLGKELIKDKCLYIKNSGRWTHVSNGTYRFTGTMGEFNYHLQPTSPCLGTGTKIPGITTDIEGNPLFPPYNIGPFGLADGALDVAPVANDGPPRNNITRLTGTSATIDSADTYILDDTNGWRVVTGWTAGTANDFFDENGVPIPFTGQQLIDAGIGYQLYYGQKGVAGYTIGQDTKSHKKIVKFLRVNTYIDSILYDPDQDYNW